MNIYFGQVEDGDDTSECFEHNDKYFYYMIDVDTEGDQVTIADTCGREIPMSLEDATELSKALRYVTDYFKLKNIANSYMNRALAGAARVYGLEPSYDDV